MKAVHHKRLKKPAGIFLSTTFIQEIQNLGPKIINLWWIEGQN